MKTINKYILMFMAAGALTLSTGCSDDFLQKDSLTAVSSSTFWKTSDDALEGLTACYDALQSTFLYNGGPWNGGPVMMDCMTDDGGHFNWSGWMNGYDICNGIHSASSGMVASYWSASYEVIKRCNSLIAKIDNVDMDEATKNQYKAEATVIRGLMYTNLTSLYHDVPYITTEQSLKDANVPKTERATIVENLMTDLKAAVNALPADAPARGRITKGAALSVLGRLALYNEKWDDAIEAYHQVIALNKYSLFPDYANLFTEANEGCDEIIFGVRFEGPGVSEGQSIGGHWDAPCEAYNGTIDFADAFYTKEGKPYADKTVCNKADNGSADLWSADKYQSRYDNRDPRLKATLFVPGMAWASKDWLYGGSAASFSTIYVKKYFNPNQSSSDSWDSGQDFYVIRYAEVLLSLAEAEIEKNTNLDEAVSLIDQVRARAGMPSVESVEGTGLSQSQLRDIVRHERRVETGFEGLRLFDLYRWHLLKDADDRINAEAEYYGFNYEHRNFRGEQEYVWPIPQTEIDANSALEQNELWK